MVTEKEIEGFILECQNPRNSGSYIYLRGQFEILLDEIRRIEAEKCEDRIIEAEEKYDALYWKYDDLKYQVRQNHPEN